MTRVTPSPSKNVTVAERNTKIRQRRLRVSPRITRWLPATLALTPMPMPTPTEQISRKWNKIIFSLLFIFFCSFRSIGFILSWENGTRRTSTRPQTQTRTHTDACEIVRMTQPIAMPANLELDYFILLYSLQSAAWVAIRSAEWEEKKTWKKWRFIESDSPREREREGRVGDWGENMTMLQSPCLRHSVAYQRFSVKCCTKRKRKQQNYGLLEVIIHHIPIYSKGCMHRMKIEHRWIEEHTSTQRTIHEIYQNEANNHPPHKMGMGETVRANR